MYLFTLLSLTILCLLHFLPMQYACACAGIVAVNNPEAYNKSPCRAIDVPFKAARSVHCKYKIFITRLHTHSACPPLGQLAASPASPADMCVQCPFSLILSFDCTDIRCKHLPFLLPPKQCITLRVLVELGKKYI